MRGRKRGNPRPTDVEARRRAFEAARLVISTGTTLPDAARQVGGVPLNGITEASVILKYGTPEEVAAAENNERALRFFADAVRARGGTKSMVKKSARSVDVRSSLQEEVAIWSRFRDALDAINSLPRPDDVKKIVLRNNMRKTTTDGNLMAAYAWITEFADAWTAT